MSQLYLFDIEGTTTDINFVHKVLFPYSKERIQKFVLDNAADPQVARAIEAVKKTVKDENHKQIDTQEVSQYLLQWIESDRKHGALKELQGLIWEKGYQSGDFQGHVYPDVKPFFHKLFSAGKKIGIYSSGSVHAQKLILGHSLEGDLTPEISYYFDTKVGGKRDSSSYANIAQEVKIPSAQIHFFSDIAEELAAAHTAGMQVTQLVRPGTRSSEFPGIADFSEFKI